MPLFSIGQQVYYHLKQRPDNCAATEWTLYYIVGIYKDTDPSFDESIMWRYRLSYKRPADLCGEKGEISYHHIPEPNLHPHEKMPKTSAEEASKNA